MAGDRRRSQERKITRVYSIGLLRGLPRVAAYPRCEYENPRTYGYPGLPKKWDAGNQSRPTASQSNNNRIQLPIQLQTELNEPCGIPKLALFLTSA